MKLFLYTCLLMTMFLVSGCEDYKTKIKEEQITQRLLREHLLSLEEEEKLINGEYSEALETLNSIEETLIEMASRNKEMDKLIRDKELAKGTNQEQLIMAQLISLKNANIEADKKAKRLRSQARKYKVQNTELKKMTDRLETKFSGIETEVNKANTTIGNMKISLAELQKEIAATESELSSAYADLKVKTSKLQRSNTELEATISDLRGKNEFIGEDAKGYIACGTKKELRNAKILRLLSDKTLTASYQNMVREYGTEINYYEDDKIDCNNGLIKLVLPQRDKNSYKIKGFIVEITDKKSFWSTSKAVVLVKK
jgi:chromosome segregation ATPase